MFVCFVLFFLPFNTSLSFSLVVGYEYNVFVVVVYQKKKKEKMMIDDDD